MSGLSINSPFLNQLGALPGQVVGSIGAGFNPLFNNPLIQVGQSQPAQGGGGFFSNLGASFQNSLFGSGSGSPSSSQGGASWGYSPSSGATTNPLGELVSGSGSSNPQSGNILSPFGTGLGVSPNSTTGSLFSGNLFGATGGGLSSMVVVALMVIIGLGFVLFGALKESGGSPKDIVSLIQK